MTYSFPSTRDPKEDFCQRVLDAYVKTTDKLKKRRWSSPENNELGKTYNLATNIQKKVRRVADRLYGTREAEQLLQLVLALGSVGDENQAYRELDAFIRKSNPPQKKGKKK